MSRDLNHLRPGFFLIFAIILQYFPSLAQDFVYQSPHTENSYQVQVMNKSQETQGVWVLFYQDEFIEEHHFEVPALTQKKLNLDGLKKPNWNFAVLTKSLLVSPLETNPNAKSSWAWSPTTRYELKIKSQKELNLNFFNLYLEKQKVTLTFLNSRSAVIKKSEFHSASFRQSLSRVEALPLGTARLVIESEAPIQVTSTEVIASAVATSRKVSAAFKYFLVQNGVGGSNFIAPIDDPDLIARARQEIVNPQGYIVFADVELNTTQANRNFSMPTKPYWSWSIKKVTGMSQIGADWCQAYPEMIERMLHGFLRQENVCFRGQRIIKELSPSEVELGKFK